MQFQLLYNTLVKVDADESTFIPDLADSWEVSPDAKSFTFKLNPDATWHDGTPVTADDVIFTAATAAQMAETYTTNGTYSIGMWTAVEGADAVAGTTDIPSGLVKVDDHTVTFNLAAPNAVWLRTIVDPAYMIMPKHIYEGMDAATLQASDGVNGVGTIGSGPYKLTSYTPDVAIEYAANEAYHKGAPNIAKLIFKLNVDPATAAAQLQSGELDMVFDLVSSDYDVLAGVEGINVERVPGIGVQFLQFATTNPLVADKRIRQAIYHAFDRRLLLETVFQGAGQILWAPLAFDASDPALNQYEHDPARAQELIAEAVADGTFDQSAPLRLIYYPEEPGWEAIALAVQQDLAAVGLNIQLDPSDAAGWEAKLPDLTAYEISLQCCGSFFHPDRTSTMFNCETPIATHYANCEMDQLFRDARETGDAAEQAAIYAQIAQILNTDVPYNWLWAVANTHANSTAVGGFTYYPNARETFAQIEKWTLTR
jgi:peptide/nickel transport system substrate-binding protein